MKAPSPPLLLAIVHGIGLASVTALRHVGGDVRPVTVPLTEVPTDPAGCALGPADASGALRDLGVAVDRGHVLLRARGQPDDAVVAELARSATGPAPVTILEFTSVLDAARTGGPLAVPNAVARLGGLLASTSDRLRFGDRPEWWLVGLGAPEFVHTTFDLRRHWQRRVQAPLSAELRLVVQASAATVVAANQRALDIARRVLGSAPFAAHGAMALVRPDTLQFVAGRGVGFGRQRVVARAPLGAEAGPVALLPFAPRTATEGLDFRGLLARFWMRALLLHGSRPTDDQAHATAPAAGQHTPAALSR